MHVEKMTKQEKNQNRGLIEREHGNNIYGSCPSRWSSFCADLIRPTFPYLFPSAASALGRPSPPFASISTDFKSMNGQQKNWILSTPLITAAVSTFRIKSCFWPPNNKLLLILTGCDRLVMIWWKRTTKRETLVGC